MPKPIDAGNAAEINFVIGKFRELPDEDKTRLARGILDNPPNSQLYADAGIEVFELILNADEAELKKHMMDALCDGENLFTMYKIWARDVPAKAAFCTHYFRNNLFEDDGTYDLPDVPMPNKKAA